MEPMDLNPITVASAAAAFGLVIALWSIGVVLLARRAAQREEALRERLSPGPGPSAQARTLRLWHEGREEVTVVRGDVAPPTLAERLEQLRRAAGWSGPLSTLLGTGGAVALASGLAAFLISGGLMPAAIAAVTGGIVFWWYLNLRIVRRVSRFERQLIDALELCARALRAGHPLLGSFRLISEEVPAPVGTIFTEVCQQQALGLRLEDALRRAALLSGSADLKLFAASLGIHIKTGGNLADVMQGLATVIRERVRLGRRFRVLVAQTQLSKRVLLLMPFVMFGVLHTVSPRYMSSLYATANGNLLLLLAGLSLMLGWATMNRMATLRP
jgi:tight adherence protein B